MIVPPIRQENDMPNQGGTHEQHVKAGQQSHKNDGDKQTRQAAADHKNKDAGQQRGGSGNFAQDRERASEAGRKGGQH
jgi:general stress protein YciG